MPRKISRYGWQPDLPDHRDHYYGDSGVMPVGIIPESIDLRPFMPAVYDQKSLGSCTANAIAGCIEFDRLKQKLPDWPPSRLFIYYNERDMEGTVNTDSGAQIRDGIKSVNTLGVCTEVDWPYVIEDFTWKPSEIAYTEAAKHLAVSYQRIINTRGELMRLCLSNGYPFVIGFTVYESFESQGTSNTGIMTMPASNEQIIGGHAVVVCGYTKIGQITPGIRHYICRNSWGPGWGDHGYFYMPEPYITNANLVDDCWTIKLVQ